LDYFQIFFATDVNAYANFDVTSGSGATGTIGSAATASIIDVGNGWFRCVITTSSATAGATVQFALITASTSARGESWTALGTETVFLWGAQLEQRSAVTAYTPTTTQPITNYVPVLLSAANNVARFDHSPTTGESLGLLIEEQRTNIVTRSEEFNDAGWNKSNSSITANTIVAPDGTLTADKLVEDTATSRHWVGRTVALIANTVYTISVYLKAGERTTATLGPLNIVNWATANNVLVDLSNGTIITAGTATIQPVGNGWYRVSITNTFGPANANGGMIIDLQTTLGYTGDGFSGIYIWGAQLEAGAFPTSYIPTVASQVTRSADAASMTGANFSSWFNNGEGSLYGESSSSRDAGTKWPFGIDGGSAANVIGVRFTSTQVEQRILTASVLEANIAASHTEGYAKTALAYRFNDFAASLNGQAVGTDTSVTIPVVSQFTIGRISGGATICGHIRKLAYYPKRLANAELQALTQN
jgi:hypothetical protein